MPPTERWPLRETRPAAVDSLTKVSSSSSTHVTNGTFMRERSRFTTVGEELGIVQEVIEPLGLLGVELPHAASQPLFSRSIRKTRSRRRWPSSWACCRASRRRPQSSLSMVGQAGRCRCDEVLARDDDLHAGGGDVLLRAGMDEPVPCDVDRLGEEHRALVGDEDVALGVGELGKPGAVDRVVLTDVEVARVLADGQVGAVGNVREVPVGRAGDGHGVAEDCASWKAFFAQLPVIT